MKFGTFELGDAEGVILAHSLKLEGGALAKGHVLTPADLQRLHGAGIGSVIAVRMEEGDLGEDEAARRIATAFAGQNHRLTPASTGRVNIHATVNGLFTADRDTVNRLNRIDPAITFACLESHVPVMAGEMVGTVKIIPLAVGAEKVEEAEAVVSAAPPFAILPFRPHAVSLVATELPSLKASVMDKTARVLARRLALSESTLLREIRCAHRADAVAAAMASALEARDADPLIVVFGASAMTDFSDVIPAAIRLAGGEVVHAGMPVDPGNLLVLGRIGDVPVIGAPGCARSPAENGFDWVLNRILAGRFPAADDLTGFGVGGLLKEIPLRPSPRDKSGTEDRPLRVAGLVLAAGSASRMGDGGHKLLAEFDGEPLVRRSARVVGEGGGSPVAVVTGHRQAEIVAALAGLDVRLVANPDYPSGMASSLVSGILSPEVSTADGVLVMLADMPGVGSADIAALVAAFRDGQGQSIIRAVSGGKRGNPVILPRTSFPAIARLVGDTGARGIIETCGLPVIDVEIGDSARLDVDTPEAVVKAGGVLKG
nr:molybdopterin-binding/glycosyltransferase family 2 protein [uncultured Gellertiella sp.]